MTPAQRLLKRAFAEKTAFVEMGADGAKPQASGPGGAPVDPAAAGGAPPGAAPMDPMAAGAPPADPMAAGAPPVDPMAAGAPPMDPAAMAPPADPMAGLPLPPEAPPVNDPAADVDGNGKPDTMVPLEPIKAFAVGLIEAMKGKKTQDAADPNSASSAGATAAGAPPLPPGPVTGLPGDMSAIAGNGPLPAPKTASILGRVKTARDIFAKRAAETLDEILAQAQRERDARSVPIFAAQRARELEVERRTAQRMARPVTTFIDDTVEAIASARPKSQPMKANANIPVLENAAKQRPIAPGQKTLLQKTNAARDIFAKTADLDTQLSSETPAQGPGRFTANKPQLETDKPSDVSMKTRETTETKPSTPAPDKLESAGKPVSEKVAGVWAKVFR